MIGFRERERERPSRSHKTLLQNKCPNNICRSLCVKKFALHTPIKETCLRDFYEIHTYSLSEGYPLINNILI